MVVDATASFALLLRGVGQLADVAEVVIRPQQGDVLRQIQSQPVELERFLVGAEYLGHFGDRAVYIGSQHRALFLDDAF